MVKYIKYKGKRYPIRVMYYALQKFQEETGIRFEDMGNSEEGQKLKHYEPLLFYSLESGAMAMKGTLDLKRKEMVAVLEECMWEFIKLLPEFFPDADMGKTIPQETRGQRRKKARDLKEK